MRSLRGISGFILTQLLTRHTILFGVFILIITQLRSIYIHAPLLRIQLTVRNHFEFVDEFITDCAEWN